MRIAITGGYGFIGEYITRACLAAGHEVIGFGRDLDYARRILPGVSWQYCDFNKDLQSEGWRLQLQSIDMVINCVGVLQRSLIDDPEAVHGDATIALFDGAMAAGVRRIIHISALGADADVETQYSQTKSRADHYLQAIDDLDWVIFKPSLIYAQNCYGGTALLRGFAGLPGFVPLLGGGIQVFQPIAMDDLVAGIMATLTQDGPIRKTIAATGPDPITMRDMIGCYRRWLGFKPVSILSVPLWVAQPILWLGDVAAYAGLNTALRSTSVRQLYKQNTADPRPFIELTGVHPKTMDAALAGMPSTIGDRLQARLFWPLGLLRITLVIFWIATGLITLFGTLGNAASPFGHLAAWLGADIAHGSVIAGGIIDIILGAWLLTGVRLRLVCLLQIAVSAAYLAVLSWLIPGLWGEPLGPLLKVFPIITATLLLAAADERR